MQDKYLNDGRKVRVLGKLNSQEMIVQEIFVTKSGDEIPSGESFTVKSLHDEPVISYKEKSAIQADERLARAKLSIEKSERELKETTEKLKGYREVLKQSKKLVDLFPENDLEILTAFMTGSIEYLVIDSYKISPPVSMIDHIVRFDGYFGSMKFDGLKLCSFIGRSDGNTQYRIHSYSDGSGGTTDVFPFVKYQDAVNHIKKRAENLINENRLSSDDYAVCLDLGIKFSDELTEKYKNKLSDSTKKSIEEEAGRIKKSQDRIKELMSKMQE